MDTISEEQLTELYIQWVMEDVLLDREAAEKVVFAAQPVVEYLGIHEVEDLEHRKHEEHRFKLKTKKTNTLFACLICSDINSHLHKGPNGRTQTLSIIGTAIAAACRTLALHVPTEISSKISFKIAIPLGATLVIAVKIIRKGELKKVIELKGHLDCPEKTEVISPQTIILANANFQRRNE